MKPKKITAVAVILMVVLTTQNVKGANPSLTVTVSQHAYSVGDTAQFHFTVTNNNPAGETITVEIKIFDLAPGHGSNVTQWKETHYLAATGDPQATKQVAVSFNTSIASTYQIKISIDEYPTVVQDDWLIFYYVVVSNITFNKSAYYIGQIPDTIRASMTITNYTSYPATPSGPITTGILEDCQTYVVDDIILRDNIGMQKAMEFDGISWTPAVPAPIHCTSPPVGRCYKPNIGDLISGGITLHEFLTEETVRITLSYELKMTDPAGIYKLTLTGAPAIEGQPEINKSAQVSVSAPEVGIKVEEPPATALIGGQYELWVNITNEHEIPATVDVSAIIRDDEGIRKDDIHLHAEMRLDDGTSRDGMMYGGIFVPPLGKRLLRLIVWIDPGAIDVATGLRKWKDGQQNEIVLKGYIQDSGDEILLNPIRFQTVHHMPVLGIDILSPGIMNISPDYQEVPFITIKFRIVNNAQTGPLEAVMDQLVIEVGYGDEPTSTGFLKHYTFKEGPIVIPRFSPNYYDFTISFQPTSPGQSNIEVGTWTILFWYDEERTIQAFAPISIEVTSVFPQHNITASPVMSIPSEVYRGQNVEMSVRVENKGDYAEGYEVWIVIQRPDGIKIKKVRLSGPPSKSPYLSPKDQVELTFSFETVEIARGGYQVVIEFYTYGPPRKMEEIPYGEFAIVPPQGYEGFILFPETNRVFYDTVNVKSTYQIEIQNRGNELASFLIELIVPGELGFAVPFPKQRLELEPGGRRTVSFDYTPSTPSEVFRTVIIKVNGAQKSETLHKISPEGVPPEGTPIPEEEERGWWPFSMDTTLIIGGLALAAFFWFRKRGKKEETGGKI